MSEAPEKQALAVAYGYVRSEFPKETFFVDIKRLFDDDDQLGNIKLGMHRYYIIIYIQKDKIGV